MRKVNLRMNELEKYEVIKNLVDKNSNKLNASIKLNCSLRNINYLIRKYQKDGKDGFIHGNRGRNPSCTKENDLKDQIVFLYTSKYDGANFAHFNELLLKNENIKVSYKFVYNTLMNNGILSPKVQKKTKKRIAKLRIITSKNQNICGELTISNNIIDLEDAHPRQERSKYFGEEIQMDSSSYCWFSNEKNNLHLSIDNNSGTVTAGFFDKEETLFGYYNLLNIILEDYGIPASFKTDNRTVFNYMKDGKSSEERDVLTQFGYACKTLGISIKTTSVAQAKGRIERLNETFQSRLPIELRLAGINNIEEANVYLKNKFIPEFNQQFALPINHTTSVFENKPNKQKINETLALLCTRVFDQGSSLRYNNAYYQAFDNGSIICFRKGTEALIIKCFNGDLLVTVNEKVYELRCLETYKKISLLFDEIPLVVKEKKKYIPPMSHPWKLDSFKKQVSKSHDQHKYA